MVVITAAGRRRILIFTTQLLATPAGNRIHSARMARMALGDTLDGHPASPYRAVNLDRLNRIEGTARPKSAARA